uniref:Uncharacterized protein n=1 Tax=Anopheles atroparvus TaxID=41427 RepID=A0A182JBL3_ANOAO
MSRMGRLDMPIFHAIPTLKHTCIGISQPAHSSSPVGGNSFEDSGLLGPPGGSDFSWMQLFSTLELSEQSLRLRSAKHWRGPGCAPAGGPETERSGAREERRKSQNEKGVKNADFLRTGANSHSGEASPILLRST